MPVCDEETLNERIRFIRHIIESILIARPSNKDGATMATAINAFVLQSLVKLPSSVERSSNKHELDYDHGWRTSGSNRRHLGDTAYVAENSDERIERVWIGRSRMAETLYKQAQPNAESRLNTTTHDAFFSEAWRPSSDSYRLWGFRDETFWLRIFALPVLNISTL